MSDPKPELGVRVNLWSVSNGYRGDGWVHVLVDAVDAEDAIAQAVPVLRERGERGSYDEDYWSGPEIRAEQITLPYLTELS